LLHTPNDSAAVPARALAAYRRMTRPLAQQEEVNALFDALLQSMPPVDSARIDGFDHVLSRDDDEWRYGFLPSDRLTIEARAWKLLDPLWSTPVNEIRLARRARVLEADYRYANIAGAGESGSETAPGRILLRQGPPQPRWQLGSRRTISAQSPRALRKVTGGWRDIAHSVWIGDDGELWRSFYSDMLLPDSVANFELSPLVGSCSPVGIVNSLASCAEGMLADWTGVPLASGLETIDVMVARFRGPRDSVDVHANARLPLRAFRYAGAPGARGADSIRWGLFIADALGNQLVQETEVRPLPRAAVREWFGQWTARVGTGSAMHRVEALEPGRPSGARGAMLFTSDSSVTIPLRGFGMSDLLIADEVRPQTPIARRWTDFTVSPNAGVVQPILPFAVLWEIYDLTPGPDGRVRWKVDIRREVGTRRSDTDLRRAMTNTRIATAKIIADEPTASSLNYTREGPASSVVVETIRMPLPENASEGRHVVAITVTDLVSGKRVTRSTSVRMLDPEAQRR
jgi:hypothetical protein